MKVIEQIKVDGTVVKFGRTLGLNEMQALVATGTKHNLIEPVAIPGQKNWTVGERCLWVHESGLIEGLPRNETASKLTGQNIVGDVFIAEHEESDFNDE